MTTRNLTTAETAKLIRKALKAFKGTKFSVRSHNYAGGSSITVGWTDGPSVADVDAVVQRFAGASFDGMQDLKTYNDAIEIDGEKVRMGADFIQTRREMSDEVREQLQAFVAEQVGVEEFDGNEYYPFDVARDHATPTLVQDSGACYNGFSLVRQLFFAYA